MITMDLRAEEQFAKVSENRVARLMKKHHLIKCKIRKKYRATTDSRHNEPVAPNLLDRNFDVSAPDKVWVGDYHLFHDQRQMVLSQCLHRPVFKNGSVLGCQ